jgi:hypothetical protein
MNLQISATVNCFMCINYYMTVAEMTAIHCTASKYGCSEIKKALHGRRFRCGKDIKAAWCSVLPAANGVVAGGTHLLVCQFDACFTAKGKYF